ncbi:MAG: hypothetical protein WA966_00235 [Ornithinimicrobium sp.]
MTEPLRIALADLEEAFTEVGAETMQHLRPGISPAEQREILAPTGLELSEELATWWQWRNGTIVPDERADYGRAEFIGIFRLTSIEESIQLSDDWRQMLASGASDQDPRVEWPTDFLTIGKSRDPYAARTGPTRESEVWTWDIDGEIDNHTRCSASLAEAVGVWARAIRERWWIWDPQAARWQLGNTEDIPVGIDLSRVVG